MNQVADAPRSTGEGLVLARGAFFSTLAFLASNLRGIFTFLVARLLGSAALGTFGLAWAATDLVSKIATWGLDTSAVAAVAERDAAGDAAGGRRVMRAVVAIALGLGVLVAAAGIAGAWTIGPALGVRRELLAATSVLLLALPGISLYRVSNALSRGKGAMHHDIYSRGCTESVATTAALLLAMAAGARALAPEIAVIAGTLASGLVALHLARPLFAQAPPASPAAEHPGVLPPPVLAAGRQHPDAAGEVGVLVRRSAPIALYGLINIGIMQLDVIMLGLHVGRVPGVTLETLGIYAAACAIAGGLRKVNQAFTPIFLPVVARQMARGDVRGAEASYGYLARWMLAILLPGIAVLALSGGAIMSVYGPAFARGSLWLAILGAACGLNAFVGLGELILVVSRPALNLTNSCVALVAAAGLNLLLIPAFGPLGAAMGMLVPYAIQGILRGVEMSWLLGWRWPWRALAKPWAAALIALPLAVAVRFAGAGLAGQLAAGALYLVGYAVAWRVIGVDASDRDVLDRLFRRVRPAPAAIATSS